MSSPYDNPALRRRQLTAMLSSCVARTSEIVCAESGKADPACAGKIASHGDEEALAAEAFKNGWRSDAAEESRVAYCPYHSQQRGLNR